MIFKNILNFSLIFLIVNQVLFTVASKKPKNDDEVDISSDDDLDFPDTNIHDDDFSEDLSKERSIQRRPLFDTKNPELIFMDEEANEEDDMDKSDDDNGEPSRKTRFPTRIKRPIPKLLRKSKKITRTQKIPEAYYPELQKDTRRIGGGILPDWNKIQNKCPKPWMVYPDCNNNME